MKSKKEKYEEAVTRNIENALKLMKCAKNDKEKKYIGKDIYTIKSSLGIRWDDVRFDDKLEKLKKG